MPAEEGKVSVLAQKMVSGKLDQLTPGSFNIVLGQELALWLGVNVGDSVIVTTDFQTSPVGAIPQLKRFTVSGIFEAGYQEYDKGLAVTNLQDLQRVLRMNTGSQQVRLAPRGIVVTQRRLALPRLWDAARRQRTAP